LGADPNLDPAYHTLYSAKCLSCGLVTRSEGEKAMLELLAHAILPYALPPETLLLFSIHGINTEETAPKNGVPVRLFGKWTGPDGVTASWGPIHGLPPIMGGRLLPQECWHVAGKGLFIHEPPLYWLPEADFQTDNPT